MFEKAKKLIIKYRHAWVLLYGLIYMPWFTYLERHVRTDYYLIHSPLDDYIPFVEYFIVPYFLWFLFIAATVAYFFFTDRKGFYRLCTFLFSGMTVFLIVCTFFPNGLDLRPAVFPRDNIFTEAVGWLYRTDTPTNVLPSIHVFNSLGASFAIGHSYALRKKRWVQPAAFTLAGLIILSTVFLKQHSVTDVFAAMALAGILYFLVYAPAGKKAPSLSHQPVRTG